MAKTIKITDDGLKKLQEELETLKTEGRADIAEKIKVARGYGDLSENSEYDEAKNDQAKLEARIVELETMLKNVEIISDIKGATNIYTSKLGEKFFSRCNAFVLDENGKITVNTKAEILNPVILCLH